MSHDESRREFLKNSLVVSAAVAGASFGLIDPLKAGAAITRTCPYVTARTLLLSPDRRSKPWAGSKDLSSPERKWLLKPNMSFARSPETGANTNPLVVREVARMCAEAGASSILIVDNVLNNPTDCNETIQDSRIL